VTFIAMVFHLLRSLVLPRRSQADASGTRT
jgi:hypothetical protein